MKNSAGSDALAFLKVWMALGGTVILSRGSEASARAQLYVHIHPVPEAQRCS